MAEDLPELGKEPTSESLPYRSLPVLLVAKPLKECEGLPFPGLIFVLFHVPVAVVAVTIAVTVAVTTLAVAVAVALLVVLRIGPPLRRGDDFRGSVPYCPHIGELPGGGGRHPQGESAAWMGGLT